MKVRVESEVVIMTFLSEKEPVDVTETRDASVISRDMVKVIVLRERDPVVSVNISELLGKSVVIAIVDSEEPSSERRRESIVIVCLSLACVPDSK